MTIQKSKAGPCYVGCQDSRHVRQFCAKMHSQIDQIKGSWITKRIPGRRGIIYSVWSPERLLSRDSPKRITVCMHWAHCQKVKLNNSLKNFYIFVHQNHQKYLGIRPTFKHLAMNQFQIKAQFWNSLIKGEVIK